MTIEATTRSDESSRLLGGVRSWLSRFEAALADDDHESVVALFHEDSHWRDMGAFTWDLGSVSGVAAIDKLMRATVADVRPTGFRVDARRTPPRRVTARGREAVEAFIAFETAGARATGLLRLVEAGDELRAWILVTRLEEVGEAPVWSEGRRPHDVGFDRSSGQTWRESRNERSSYADRDPEVLVVGGGHHGLFAAVNLQRLGADVLVVDRFPRVGDNWRTRYESLALHNLTDMCHFPGLRFPDSFPEYLPKDLLANWFEAYVEAMQLNYWTSTEFVGGEYDEVAGRWTVTLRQEDGSDRVMRPRHVVISTGGVGGRPNVPHLDGIENFRGPVLHSKDFRSGADHAGKRVLVVGVGTSGHDTARDLHLQGAQPVLLQRSPVAVVNMATANKCYPPAYFDGTPLEEADYMSMGSFVYPLLEEGLSALGRMSRDEDRELLDALEAAGLRIEDDEHGWIWKVYAKFSGYYINVGASELIVEGKIGVRQQADLRGFTADAALFADGPEPFDAVVLATGYLNQQHETEAFFGREVAEKVGPIGGFDEVGELRNAFKPTAQPGLWFTTSGISSGRALAVHMAALIKADLDGLVPGHRHGFIAANGGTHF